MEQRIKLVRLTTVPISLKVLLRQQLRFLSAYFDVLAVSSPGPVLVEVSAQEGVRVAAVNMQRAITPVKDAVALWQLYRLFKKEQPVIVHSHTPKAGLLGMVAAWLAGVPVRMHTVAGLPLMEASGFRRKILGWAEQLTCRCATRVYPNSLHLARFMEEQQYCVQAKMKVLGKGSSNGVDTEFFQPDSRINAKAALLKTKLAIEESDFVFLFIGRLVRDKGIEELVQAFCELKKKHPHIKLLLVGPFEPERDPLSPAALCKIKEDAGIVHVDFQQDVRPYLAMSRVLVFPTYREGFPNVPLQAGCFHLPCIVTDINGCNEIIEHEKNGLIIAVKNKPALQEAMERLLTDRPLYQKLKMNARKMVCDRYEQKQFWNLLLKEYQDQLTTHVRLSQLPEAAI